MSFERVSNLDSLRLNRRELLKRIFISAGIASISSLVVACGDSPSQPQPEQSGSPSRTGLVSQSLPPASATPVRGIAKPDGLEVIGPVSSFKPEADPAGIAIKGKNVLVFNHAGELYVFSDICTHQGCQVEFLAKPQKFICPCHGSEFDKSGELIKGPAPTRLPKISFKIINDTLFVNPN